jgi:hypothetical protein
LTGLLRHASRIAGNSRKTIKDIAKHSVLITYITRYLNVQVDETFNIINNDRTEINDAYVVGKNQIIEDLSSLEVVKTDESLLLRFVNAAFNNKPESRDVLPPPDAEEKSNIESEVQTEVMSKTVETTIDEEGVFNLELEGSFNVNNNSIDCDIQTETAPKFDEETNEKEGHVTNLLSSTTQYAVTSMTTQTNKLLLNNEKQCAEHKLLVDLGRNDVGKIFKPCYVQVEKLMNIDRYSDVMHISSTATGELLAGLTICYLKLEEKNRAFKEEKSWYDVRLKEEQKVAIKLTRKNLVIKAKPVLSFYYYKRISQYQANEALY